MVTAGYGDEIPILWLLPSRAGSDAELRVELARRLPRAIWRDGADGQPWWAMQPPPRLIVLDPWSERGTEGLVLISELATAFPAARIVAITSRTDGAAFGAAGRCGAAAVVSREAATFSEQFRTLLTLATGVPHPDEVEGP
jgi:DNA-binding NarL/FixJ family response regulator